MAPQAALFDPTTITRPAPALMTYYLLCSALTVFLFPIMALLFWIRFRTLRYAFDDEGVSMSWGMLFKREVYLTYRRIQDIHVTRNVFHRWLGLADVAVQTASGASGAEMTIVGVLEAEALRDYLYARMRGARTHGTDDTSENGATREHADEALTLLREIRDALREQPGTRS
ncbi:MAG: PH domain-containing protein [Planctomycetota bacterium]|jgi:putative membrane protein